MTPGTLGRALVMASCVLATPGSVVGAVPTLQGAVGASVYGPRRIAATSSGQFLVIDARGRLHLLTKRGDLVGKVLDDVRSVAAGGGKAYAVTARAELVTLDEQLGTVLKRSRLSVSEAPNGLAWDDSRQVLWMVFGSGGVWAVRPDGSVATQFGPATTGAVYGLQDVSVDAASGLVWIARDREDPAGMVFGVDPATGLSAKVVGVGGTGPARLTGALLVGAGGLYLADLVSGVVEVIAADGAKLQTIGLSDAGVGTLSRPAGLAFMQNGDLLVANLNTSKLLRFGDGSPLPACAGDTDCDGMADAWETAYGLDPLSAQDALADKDGDGLPNLQEFALGTDPTKADTDGDGVPDGEEVANGTDPLTPPNRKPVLVASGATEFAPGIVRLSAIVSGIQDPSGCKASWTQVAGTPVKLAGASGFAPTFVARKAETHRFAVVATCAGIASDAAEVTATVVNQAPLAEAARVLVVGEGERAELSARDSSDANGDPLSFGWEQVGGAAVTAGSATSALSVGIPAEGSYRFRVGVADPAGAHGLAETQVAVLGNHRVPVAAAASPVVGEVGQPIPLDASASYRKGGSIFDWRQVGGPQVAIANASQPVASFVAPEAGRYLFEVTVSKNGLASPAAVVEAYVGAPAQALPVASAAAPVVAAVGTEVTLDGSASASSAGALEYAWRQVSGPAAGLGQADRALAKAYLFAAGSYEFELTVKDAAGVGVPAKVRVEGRAAGKAIPVAKISGPAAAVTGEKVVLDASGSTGATRFRWSQAGGPWVLLGGGPAVAFKPKAAGTYVFELVVDDGQVRSAPARVSVVVTGDETEN